jgi:hypothetical protein
MLLKKIYERIREKLYRVFHPKEAQKMTEKKEETYGVEPKIKEQGINALLWQVKKSNGVVYTVNLETQKCDCPATRRCKHFALVEGERERLKEMEVEKVKETGKEVAIRPEVIAVAQPVSPRPIALQLMESPERAVELLDRIKNSFSALLKKNNEIIIIKTKKGPKEYVKYEGWATLGISMGILPEVEWTKEIKDDGKLIGFEARALAKLVSNGQAVGAGEAECCFNEERWKTSPRFAVKSMAQTRACGKALKTVLSGIIAHLGFEATPAEEMDHVAKETGPIKENSKALSDIYDLQKALGWNDARLDNEAVITSRGKKLKELPEPMLVDLRDKMKKLYEEKGK